MTWTRWGRWGVDLYKFTLDGELLNGSALSTAVVGWQGESLHAAAGTNTAGQHIVRVKVITTLRQNKFFFFFFKFLNFSILCIYIFAR